MKKRTIILIHLLYWFYIVGQFLFPVYAGQHKDPGMWEAQYLREVMIGLFLNVLTFYTVYFTFTRIIAFRNKLFITAVMLLLLVGVTAIRLPIDWYFRRFTGEMPENVMVFEWIWVWNHLRLAVITMIYAVLIRYLIDAFEAQKLKAELVNQKQAGELALLRSQVNPHFLFNTLNNIYSLVYQKSEEAPGAVMKFSSIMRYVLYEAEAELVPLEKEIEYLKSYIELQQLRFRQSGLVSMTVEGDTGGIAIAPMLFMPFVENAFKHGPKNHQPAMEIHIHAAAKSVDFSISNYTRTGIHVSEPSSPGVGIANIRRRLELLYPGRFTLATGEEEGMFRVNLHLEYSRKTR